MLKTTVVGNYPKLPSQKGDVNIRRLLHRFDKQEISREELDRGYDEVTARVIREQNDAGIDLPTDGQVRWDDIVTPFAAKGHGFEIGGLLRWFDNNVYYRKPQIVSKIEWSEPVALSSHRFAFKTAVKAVKAVLPAPFSFALLSEDKHYHNLEKLITDLTAFLRSETKALIEAGCETIQFDDPCLQYHPEMATLAIQSLNEVVKGLPAEFWLCFYFGRISPLATRFKEFNVQVIAADCVSHAENYDALLRSSNGKQLSFGLLDARNIKLEHEDFLKKKYTEISAIVPNAYISPSCGLEFLPHRDALRKIQLLGRSVKDFNEGGRHA